MPDHELIADALEYVKQTGYRDDPDFPPLPDVPVLGQSGHVTAHDRILAVLEYVRDNAAGAFSWATVSNNPTGTYKGDDGHTYAYYLFEDDGTLTVSTAGLLDLVIVSGGAGGTAANIAGGGSWMYGYYPLDAGSHSVVVGAGGPGGQISLGAGYPSSVGDLQAQAGELGSRFVSFTSSITGTEVEYCRPAVSAPRPNHGDGGNGNNAGSSGVVIARTRLN